MSETTYVVDPDSFEGTDAVKIQRAVDSVPWSIREPLVIHFNRRYDFQPGESVNVVPQGASGSFRFYGHGGRILSLNGGIPDVPVFRFGDTEGHKIWNSVIENLRVEHTGNDQTLRPYSYQLEHVDELVMRGCHGSIESTGLSKYIELAHHWAGGTGDRPAISLQSNICHIRGGKVQQCSHSHGLYLNGTGIYVDGLDISLCNGQAAAAALLENVDSGRISLYTEQCVGQSQVVARNCIGTDLHGRVSCSNSTGVWSEFAYDLINCRGISVSGIAHKPTVAPVRQAGCSQVRDDLLVRL